MADEFTVVRLQAGKREQSAPANTKSRARVWPVRPSKLVWVPIVAALWWVTQVYGTPHLRFQYTWSGHPDRPIFHVCDYVGLHSQRVHPRFGERCPLIRLLTAAAREGSR